MWSLLENRPETRALYTDDATETSDKLPFSIRQAMGNFPFEIDFTSYDNPGGYKEFFGMIGKISKTPEQRAVWTRWWKLPVSTADATPKKHTHLTLFKLFQALADSEAEILVLVQNEILAKEDVDSVPQPEPAPERSPVEVKQEVMEVDEPVTLRVHPRTATPAVIGAPNGATPDSISRSIESASLVLARINANIRKQTADRLKAEMCSNKRVSFMETTAGMRHPPVIDPLEGILNILKKYTK